MAQAVSRRPHNAEARLPPRSVHVGFVVDKVAMGQGFPPSFSVPLSISFHRGFHTHISFGDQQQASW
jgi:hypothetical protein